MSNQLEFCPCGKSPAGSCMGFHGLTGQTYLEHLAKYIDSCKDEPEYDLLLDFQEKMVKEHSNES